jgi:hypothetical protein
MPRTITVTAVDLAAERLEYAKVDGAWRERTDFVLTWSDGTQTVESLDRALGAQGAAFVQGRLDNILAAKRAADL